MGPALPPFLRDGRTDTRLDNKLGAATGPAGQHLTVLDGRALSRRASRPLAAGAGSTSHSYSPAFCPCPCPIRRRRVTRACMRLRRACPQSKEGSRPDDDLSPPSPTSEAANQYPQQQLVASCACASLLPLLGFYCNHLLLPLAAAAVAVLIARV